MPAVTSSERLSSSTFHACDDEERMRVDELELRHHAVEGDRLALVVDAGNRMMRGRWHGTQQGSDQDKSRAHASIIAQQSDLVPPTAYRHYVAKESDRTLVARTAFGVVGRSRDGTPARRRRGRSATCASLGRGRRTHDRDHSRALQGLRLHLRRGSAGQAGSLPVVQGLAPVRAADSHSVAI